MTPRRGPSALAVTAWVIVLGLLAGAAVVAWQVWGTDALGRRAARATVTAARADFAAQRPHEGVVAVLSSPKLGEWPVLAGVGDQQLHGAVGWYPRGAKPGEPGNVALAGRRVTHGSPLRHLPDLRPGDTITLTTAKASFVYVVKAAPAQVEAGPKGAWVLDPVPGQKKVAPTASVLTLTTAADLVATDRRLVVFAELQG